jgi:hypothetical protein
LGTENFLWVGIEPGAVPASYVEEEKFGGEGIGGDMGFAEKVNALFKRGADVEGVGF